MDPLRTIARISVIVVFLVPSVVRVEAHDAHNGTSALRAWCRTQDRTPLEGTFLYERSGVVYIETAHHGSIAVPLGQLCEEDRGFVQRRQAWINALNHRAPIPAQSHHGGSGLGWVVIAIVGFACVVATARHWRSPSPGWKPAAIASAGIFVAGIGAGPLRSSRSVTDPLTMNSAFAPFKPHVTTQWDDDWFYVGSNGLARHEMMTGIVAWQQQVPIPQCYMGSNAWPVPLNPVQADTVIPVDSVHFTRGAVAVAVNGIPIFNPHTNTGTDAFLDGQLDEYGGHSGRADDYHYHIAPLHLYAFTAATRPIAFALDGYAVYGDTEPEGGPMQALDENHGHYGSDGVYHYHGTAEAPYMIGNMVGHVTEDSTHQIVPQAHAHPVRPSLTPLNGAAIVAHTPNADTTGFTLVYVRNGNTDSIEYDWTIDGTYTYRFYVDGAMTTEVYDGPVPCELVTGVHAWNHRPFSLFPSPTENGFWIDGGSTFSEHDVISVTVFDLRGEVVVHEKGKVSYIDLGGSPAGTYMVRVNVHGGTYTQRVVLR